ncbi:MAG: hypothetical protein RL839_12610 [Gammaproteobacteria bacterium]
MIIQLARKLAACKLIGVRYQVLREQLHDVARRSEAAPIQS